MLSGYMKKWNANTVVTGLLLGLYIAFLIVSFVVVHISTDIAPLFFVLILAVSLGISYLLLHILRRTWLARTQSKTLKQKLLVFFIASGIAFLIQFIVYLGFAPGCASYDVLYQFRQTLDNHYNDWHPFWQTLVFFTLPYKITGSFASITLFQQILYALVFGYMNLVVYDLRGWKTLLIMDALILPNPYVLLYLMYPWKDLGFAFACMTALLMSIQIYYQHNKATPWFLAAQGVVSANAALFRHNGILFAVPMVLAVMALLPKRKWIPLLLGFVIMFVIVKVPLARMLHIEPPGDRVTETMGLPLTMIGNVAHKTPEALDEETAEFVYSLGPPEFWEDSYVTGDFNSVKWYIDTKLINDKGRAGILRMLRSCLASSAKASLEGFFALTDIVYSFESVQDGVMDYDVMPNDSGVEYSGDPQLRQHILNYSNTIIQSVFRYLCTYGVGIFVILALILSRLRFKSWQTWKKVFFAFPLLIYDFGTALLLTGLDFRFFWVTYLAVPVLIVFLLIRDKNEAEVSMQAERAG